MLDYWWLEFHPDDDKSIHIPYWWDIWTIPSPSRTTQASAEIVLHDQMPLFRRRYALAIAMVCLSINSGLSSLHQAEWPCQASTLWRFPATLLEPVFAPWKERTYDTNQLNCKDSIKTTRVRSISPCLCYRMVVELCTLCKDRKRSLGRWVKEKHEVLLSCKTCQQSRNKKSSASV